MKLEKQIEVLNDVLGEAIRTKDIHIINENAREYIGLLEQYLPPILDQLVDSNDAPDCIALLQKIFKAQYSLM